MSPETTSQVPSATGRHTPLKTYCHPKSRPQKAIEWLRFSLGRENKSKHRQLRFALFSLIGSSRFLLLFLLRSIWINVTSFWSLLFSLWLFIYLFQLHPREQRNAEWSLTAMSNISFCQIWPFSLSAVTWCLYVRLRVRHSERGEGALSEWPPQEGSTKSKKESKSKGRMNPRAGGKCKGGEGGTPAGSQASWLAVPILASDVFCHRGEKRVSSSLGHGRIDVLSVGEGVLAGENGGMLKRGIKPRTHLHKGWGGGGAGWAALWDWADVETRMIY